MSPDDTTNAPGTPRPRSLYVLLSAMLLIVGVALLHGQCRVAEDVEELPSSERESIDARLLGRPAPPSEETLPTNETTKTPETDTDGMFVLRGKVLGARHRCGIPNCIVQVREPERGTEHAARTDDSGAFLLEGLRENRVRIHCHPRGAVGLAHEFVPLDEVEIHVADSPVELVVHRNPRVRIFGYVRDLVENDIAPYPPLARCRPLDIYPIEVLSGGKMREQTMRFYSRRGFHVPPGNWKFRVRFGGAEVMTTDAQQLALDDAVDLDLPMRLSPNLAAVAVSFDVWGFEVYDPGCRSAVEALVLAPAGESYQVRRNAEGNRLLLVLPPGDYHVVGALDKGDEVRMSVPTRLRVGPGEHRRLLLETTRAGGILVSAVPTPGRGDSHLRLLELDDPGHGAVYSPLFDFRWLSDRESPTLWWVPAGRFTLVREDPEEGELDRLILDVAAGRVLEVIEVDGRLRRREKPR